MSFVVLTRKQFMSRSAALLLKTLALVDSLVLIVALTRYVEDVFPQCMQHRVSSIIIQIFIIISDVNRIELLV